MTSSTETTSTTTATPTPTPTPTATTTATATATLSLPHYSYGPNQNHTVGRRRGGCGAGAVVSQQYPRHLLAYSLISILVILCGLPDIIVALKDVSVTIPQAVKRGSNAMLTCNYDMENDTLYSVKWYKGRREFYRYTPKENPAMKVFLTQSGLNVERNLSNQSHVVLLAVPLNISGKFTCEISVEAPSFQTAMVSGEMEVVELPEEQASVTGIQPRYRIGDLVDGNCSIKYSKPAANLTWTINGIVVPPHHIKTYQIEKYDETNLESVMSAIHFMVTTQHFIKGQMRLKCTAAIFDIFKEEIESIIEEDRPRIMASGRSYDAHSYPHDNGEGYEDHNESYLTYFSAPKSSASRLARPPLSLEFQQFYKLLLQHLSATLSTWRNIKSRICSTLTIFIIDIERYYEKITQNDMTTYCVILLQQQQHQQQQQLITLITVMAILLGIYQHKHGCQLDAMASVIFLGAKQTMAKNSKRGKGQFCNDNGILMEAEKTKGISFAMALSGWHEMKQQQQQQISAKQSTTCKQLKQKWCAGRTNNADNGETVSDDCQQLAPNQNAINATASISPSMVRRAVIAGNTSNTLQNYQQILDCTTTVRRIFLPLSPSLCYNALRTSDVNGSSIMCANASLRLYENAFNMTKSNNANYMSKYQILLMTAVAKTSCQQNSSACKCATANVSALENATSWCFRNVTLHKATEWLTSLSMPFDLGPQSLPACTATSPWISLRGFTRFPLSNTYLMAFIADLLVHHC